jgi:hypothetical protein
MALSRNHLCRCDHAGQGPGICAISSLSWRSEEVPLLYDVNGLEQKRGQESTKQSSCTGEVKDRRELQLSTRPVGGTWYLSGSHLAAPQRSLAVYMYPTSASAQHGDSPHPFVQTSVDALWCLHW